MVKDAVEELGRHWGRVGREGGGVVTCSLFVHVHWFIYHLFS